MQVAEGIGPLVIELTPSSKRNAAEWEGIGGTLDWKKSPHWRFTDFVPGAGATAAGLLAGDRILGVDGVDADGLEMNELISRLRGPADTFVRVKVLRGGNTLEFNVVRRRLTRE